MRVVKTILFAVAVAVMLCVSGCKKYSSDCHVIIRPRVIQVQSSPAGGEAAYMVRMYAYYISKKEIENWAPYSYESADAGTIRNNITGELRGWDFMTQQADYIGTVPDEDTYIHFTFSQSPVLLVAVDPINKFYAWRHIEIPVPLETLHITLRFVLWRDKAQYKELKWNVVNSSLQENE